MGIKKGRTYEDIYGIQEAKRQRNIRKCSRPECGENLIDIQLKKKGKTMEEFYGVKKAKQIKEKRLKTLIIKYGENYQKNISKIKWSKEKIIIDYKKIIQKYGSITKSRIRKLYLSDGFCSQGVIFRMFGSLDNFAIEINIPFKLPNRLGKGFGKKETFILDMYERLFDKTIIRQYPVKTESGLYFLDGFIEQDNLAIEIDEEYHNSQQIKDYIREDAIRNKLGCHIIRIDDVSFGWQNET